MARLVRRHRRRPRPRPGTIPVDEAPRAGSHQAGRLPGHGVDPLREHDPGRRRAVVPRRRVPGAPDPRLHPLERRRHGHAGQHAHRGHRRAPLHLRQLGRALRGRLQPLLPRQGRRWLRRPGLLPGARLARHLRPGLRRGPADRAGAGQLPPRGGRGRATQLSPPALAARLLGVPHRVDGPWPARRHLPGPREPLPRASSPRRHERQPGLVLRGRRRDGRARVHRWPRRGRARAPRQPHLRGQLQPAAARRPRARQRQDNPGARGGVPRRGVERDQGDLGLAVGRAVGQGRRRRPAGPHEHDARRRVPEAGRRVRRLHPGAFLRPRPPPAQDGRGPERRRAGVAPPRRARLPQALRRLQAGHRATGRSHRHPGQDDQGMDARSGDRGPQRHPPDQEDDQGTAAHAPRPALPDRGHPRRRARG